MIDKAMKKHSSYFIGFLFLMVFLLQGRLSAADKLYIWNAEELEAIKTDPSKKALADRYVAKADSCLLLQPLTVVDKSWSFAENMHYYCTMAPYWWPEEIDGKTVYVNRDGYVNPQSLDLDKAKIAQLGDRMKHLSLAYYFTGDRRYFDAYREQLDVWFIDQDTYMYPDFLYAQVIPGRNGNKGRGIGIGEGHGFNDVLESFRLIDSVRSVGTRRRGKVIAWFRRLGDWMATSEQGIQQAKMNNNLGISYDTTLANISLFVGNRARAERIFDQFSEKRTYKQIEEDGKMPGELQRTKAFSYSVYCLDYFTDFFLLASSAGTDAYDRDRDRYNAAYRFLLQFVDNHEAFPYNQIIGWRDSTRSLYDQINRLKRIDPEIADRLTIKSASSVEK